MAIVHIATKAISRKAGQSAVASAAYRAGVILKDERYDKSHDYSKKSGVMSADIILPTALKAKGLTVSREELWNKAEEVEGRSDSRVAREWLVNLPYELDEAKRKTLAHEFTQALADKYNIIADCAIHSPSKKEVARGADPRNYHAHILVTTREAKMDADGQLFFDKQFKIPFEWSNKKRDANGLQSSIQEIKDIRQLWVDMANKALVGLDLAELDARSFKDQGLDRLPTIKMGVDATNMERKGINTEQGNKNRAIHVVNQRKELTKQSKQRVADEQHTVEYTEWAAERIEWATNRNQQIVKRIDDNQQRIETRKRDTEWAVETNKTFISDIERVSRWITWTDKRASFVNQISKGSEPYIKASKQRIARCQQQARDVNKLITDRANAITTAPNPFDDKARRTRATKITEQQGRFDRKTAEEDRGVENAFERAKLVRLRYVKKWLNRHKDSDRLRPGFRESSDDYPDKLDYRQDDLLDAFAEKFGLNKTDDEGYQNYMKRMIDRFDSKLVTENKAVINILRDPKTERDQYDAIKIHYDTFIKNLDEEREAVDSKTRSDLGNVGGISKMIAGSISAPSYIESLDSYINDEANEDLNIALAIKHRTYTINHTCQQFKHSFTGLRDLQQANQHRTHSEALQGSLNTFMSSYGKELSDEQQEAINDGLNANKQQVQSNTMRLRF